MKSKFLRLISSLLILSFLVATLSVFSFAEDTGSGSESKVENMDNLSVIINRGFEEGWNYNNGFSNVSLGSNSVYIDHDEDLLGKYNYFVRCEAASSNAATMRVDFGAEAVTHASKNTVKASIIEFAIKVDDVAKLGNILYFNTAVGRKKVKMLDINADGELIAFNGVSSETCNLGKVGDEWINIAYIFDWTWTDTESSNFKCTIKLGYGLGKGYSESYDLTVAYPAENDIGIYQLFFGLPKDTERSEKAASESYGMSYCFDNLKIYQGVTGVVELDPKSYGSAVNTLADKVIDIQESAGVKSKAQILEEALAMKVGVDYALVRNERCSLVNNSDREDYNSSYGAPVKQGDNVLIPLQLLLDYIGFPSYIHPDNLSFDITTGTSTTYIMIGRDTATVDGVRVNLSVAPGYVENSEGKDYLVIALTDVSVLFPGWIAIYDDMGLAIIYEDTTPEDITDNEPIVNRNEDLSTMVNIMKKFVFDTTTADVALDGYIENGTLIYNDTKKNTDNFAHPYIIADQSVFDKLAERYALNSGDAGYDAVLKTYIQSIVSQADGYYLEYAELAGDVYVGIKEGKAPISKYAGDGYDSKGEMAELLQYANVLPTLAFAYQITGNDDYARLAYDFAATLASWSHWGPGYMTHCAQIVSAYAIAYDWLYNAYEKLGFDTVVIANAIFELGVHDGYVSSIGNVAEHPRGLGDLSSYNMNTDSTNAVGTSGMIIGSLAILDFITSENAPETAYDETVYVLGNNIQNLVQFGLDIYAPDGSYIESATYWELATSNLFRMIMALSSATGSDYGLMDTWGLNKTCYYAIHIESSDGFIWNYHDGGLDGIPSSIYEPEELASLNTDMLNFVGAYLGDANLIAIRDYQLKTTKSATIYDLLFYPFDGITKAPELALDYHMEAIDGYVSRSDWNEGAMYTGLMGGSNNANHGHIDSGNFIYYNKGISWIADLGTENPYVQDYNVAGTRYQYYRASSEGQNVIIVTDDTTNTAYGQYTKAGGYITKTYQNEHGSYVHLDNSSVYPNMVSFAKRGMLVTNDRQTVVLQDELSFIKVRSLAWIVHTGANVEIADGGRTAYLTETDANGETITLRASIVSPRPDFVFTEKPVTSPLLAKTFTPDKISGEPEYSRSGISRLVIESTTVSFDVAVVFEIIEDKDNMPAVGYRWTSMSQWEPSAPTTSDDEVVEAEKRGTPQQLDIKNYTTKASAILGESSAYTSKIEDLYDALTSVGYALKTYPAQSLPAGLLVSYADYLDCVNDYNSYIDFVNGNSAVLAGLTKSLSGIQAAEDLQ